MTAADVVVVGGGIIGSAITYYLTSRGCRVVLVERNGLTSGTSGACGGSLTMQTKRAGSLFGCALESLQLYRTLSDELGIDLEYEQQGSLIVAETDLELDHIRQLASSQLTAGLTIEWLDGATARAWGPGLGSSIRAATFCPTDAEVNPLKVTLGFAEAARRLGAKIWTHTNVTGIRIWEQKVVGARTDRGDIAAPTVVIAAGVWSEMVGAMAAVDVPVRPRRGVVLVTDPAPISVGGTLFSAKYLTSKHRAISRSPTTECTRSFAGGLVVSQTAAGNLLVGSSRELAGFETATPVGVITFIAREAVRVMPAIAKLRMIRAYSGLRPLSPDGLPIIGRVPKLPGLVLAAGHEGDGVALAPWTGRMVAELIQTREIPQELVPFDPQRFGQPG